MSKNVLVLPCFFFIFAIFGSNPVVFGDTIRLANGNTIYGKIAQYEQKPGYYIVKFSNGGWMLLKFEEVVEFHEDTRDQFEERETK